MFKNRSFDQEIMDNLQIEGHLVDQSLEELHLINKWLGGYAIIFDGLEKILKRKPIQHLSILDLGCGRGDMLNAVAEWAISRNIAINLTGLDANPHIIDIANKHNKYPELITYKTLDVLNIPENGASYDIIMNTLFCHHFDDHQLVDLFGTWTRKAKSAVLINDLHRHWLAYYSIKGITRLFSKSTMVRNDAPLSVLKAFKRKEIESILKRAKVKHYSLAWKWAFRYQLIIFT